MKAAQLLEELSRRGVEITICGGKLRLRGPAKSLPTEIRALIADRKPEIISSLCGATARPDDEIGPAGRKKAFGPLRVDRVNSVIWESGERLNAAFPDGAEGFHERLRV
ncbi:MAG: hypothetical protein HYY84_13675 [Deltaproteobacteria bacterium]|nr:hypothetical protein [Deltaproteobacteria bacterium]